MNSTCGSHTSISSQVIVSIDSSREVTSKTYRADVFCLSDLYILCLGVIGFIILYPDGNLSSTDAYFFGVSGSTESGLNVVDLNKMRLYQQITLYFLPILGNMQVVSILVVIFRFIYFRHHLRQKANVVRQRHMRTELVRGAIDVGDAVDAGRNLSSKDVLPRPQTQTADPDYDSKHQSVPDEFDRQDLDHVQHTMSSTNTHPDQKQRSQLVQSVSLPEGPLGSATSVPLVGIRKANTDFPATSGVDSDTSGRVTFAPDTHPLRRSSLAPLPSDDSDVYSLDEKRGRSYDPDFAEPKLGLARTRSNEAHEAALRLRSSRRGRRGPSPDKISLRRVVTNAFELGGGAVPDGTSHARGRANGMNASLGRTLTSDSSDSRARSRQDQRRQSHMQRLKLSTDAILGRNSHFTNLTEEDRNWLGGIEYRALKLLLKVILSYYVSLHLIGIICLTPWIYLTKEDKYRTYLARSGINATWWYVCHPP